MNGVRFLRRRGTVVDCVLAAIVLLSAASCCWAATEESDLGAKVGQISFVPPTPDLPFWHIVAPVSLERAGKVDIDGSTVNGAVEPTAFVLVEGYRWRRPYIDNTPGQKLIVRVPWVKGENYDIVLKLSAGKGERSEHGTYAGEEADVVLTGNVKMEGTPKADGGYWNPAWPHYASIAVTEEAGIERKNEPVHATIQMFSDQCADSKKEIRVVEVDGTSVKEVPSQVYQVLKFDPKKWIQRADDKYSDVRYLPTTSCRVVFLTDMEPRQRKAFIAFWGNKEADTPVYDTDLKVRDVDIAPYEEYVKMVDDFGFHMGRVIDNELGRMVTHPVNGQIDQVRIKREINMSFFHHVETNGAVHWNPGCYSPPREWVHVADWKPNINFEEEIGPVMYRTRRWGPLPQVPEVTCSVTYEWYAGLPYMFMWSTFRVDKDMHVKALRNAEMVFIYQPEKGMVAFNEFAYKSSSGRVDSLDVGTVPAGEKVIFESMPDWVSAYHQKKECGFVSVPLEENHFNSYGSRPGSLQPHMYLNVGPWIYWSRAYAYTFHTNNQQMMTPIPAGSTYTEKWALSMFKLGKKASDRFAEPDMLAKVLRKPLKVEVEFAKDPREPERMPEVFLIGEDPYNIKGQRRWLKVEED